MIHILACIGLGTLTILCLPFLAYMLGYLLEVVDSINKRGG